MAISDQQSFEFGACATAGTCAIWQHAWFVSCLLAFCFVLLAIVAVAAAVLPTANEPSVGLPLGFFLAALACSAVALLATAFLAFSKSLAIVSAAAIAALLLGSLIIGRRGLEDALQHWLGPLLHAAAQHGRPEAWQLVLKRAFCSKCCRALNMLRMRTQHSTDCDEEKLEAQPHTLAGDDDSGSWSLLQQRIRWTALWCMQSILPLTYQAKDTGKTALHIAVENENKEAVNTLVFWATSQARRSQLLCAQDGEGRTALHTAVKCSSRSLAKLLLDHGADMHTLDSKGFTPLGLAVNLEKHDSDQPDATADKDARDARENANHAKEALMYAQEQMDVALDEMLPTAEHEPPESASLALHWVDIACSAAKGFPKEERKSTHSALSRTSQTDLKVKLTEAIKDAVVAVQQAECEAKSKAKIAAPAWFKQKQLVRLLLRRGAMIAPRAADGQTVLHIAAAACIKGKGTTAAVLKERKKGEKETTAAALYKDMLHDLLGQCSEQPELIDAQDHAGFTPLACAVKSGNIAAVELLLQKGANPMPSGRQRHIPLHLAVLAGYAQLVQLLLKHDAPADVQQPDDNMTPLAVAAKLGRQQIAEMLVQGGAKLSTTCVRGRTPLIWAARIGHHRLVKLLSSGGVVNSSDALDRTALHEAAKAGFSEFVSELLKVPGLDVDLKDVNKKTALELARKHETTEGLLRKHADGTDSASSSSALAHHPSTPSMEAGDSTPRCVSVPSARPTVEDSASQLQPTSSRTASASQPVVPRVLAVDFQ